MPILPLERTEQKTRLFDPYKVLLHNDDNNDMEYVVTSLIKAIPQLSKAQAAEIMAEAHRTGVALVLMAPQEHAEMHCERLQSFGLVASIEKDV